jgi:1-acyl-sn-glycerol-3-phosphate acyltransferase
MQRLAGVLRYLFFLLIVRPIMLVVLGFNVRGYERLPKQGPLLVVANHNSHLDALALMTLFGMKRLKNVRAVAGADYFLRHRCLAWFSLNVIGIIPLDRKLRRPTHEHPLASVFNALEHGRIVIYFPEGTRGEPEKLDQFKTGVAHIAERYPELPVTPVFMHGFGKSLPRGEALLVPFICDLFIGDTIRWTGDRDSFMDHLNGAMRSLAEEAGVCTWE